MKLFNIIFTIYFQFLDKNPNETFVQFRIVNVWHGVKSSGRWVISGIQGQSVTNRSNPFIVNCNILESVQLILSERILMTAKRTAQNSDNILTKYNWLIQLNHSEYLKYIEYISLSSWDDSIKNNFSLERKLNTNKQLLLK